MVRDIVTDLEILQMKSMKADIEKDETKQTIADLIDTANEHKGRCVGLSAIQIGVPLRVCVVFNGDEFVPFVNPIILKKWDKYETEEGCMSLDGLREVSRYDRIEILRKTRTGFIKEKYKGYMAQILQHEIDHFDGKLI